MTHVGSQRLIVNDLFQLIQPRPDDVESVVAVVCREPTPQTQA